MAMSAFSNVETGDMKAFASHFKLRNYDKQNLGVESILLENLFWGIKALGIMQDIPGKGLFTIRMAHFILHLFSCSDATQKMPKTFETEISPLYIVSFQSYCLKWCNVPLCFRILQPTALSKTYWVLLTFNRECCVCKYGDGYESSFL